MEYVISGCLCDQGPGVPAHEFAHMLGMHHEQSRPDRDDHITVVVSNISPSNLNNFVASFYLSVSTYDAPYNFGSVMQYRPSVSIYNA